MLLTTAAAALLSVVSSSATDASAIVQTAPADQTRQTPQPGQANPPGQAGQTGAPPLIGQSPERSAQPSAMPQPLVFKPLNYDDDWRPLRAGGDNSGWAKLKAIPVGPGGWLSLGGELRYRAEYRGNERFGRGLQDDDGDLQQRLRLWADLHLTPRLRAFVDIQDARSEGLDSGEPVNFRIHTTPHVLRNGVL